MKISAPAVQHFSAADGRLVLAFAVIRLLALWGYDKSDSYESIEAIVAQEWRSKLLIWLAYGN